MRQDVFLKLGAKEHALRPAFSVVDAFETKFGSVLEHLENLMQGRATIHARGLLVFEGLKAGNPDVDWDLETVKERMFDEGYWHESLVMKEAEFVERLLYTPEQYTAKKAERAAEAEREKAEADRLSAIFSESQSSI